MRCGEILRPSVPWRGKFNQAAIADRLSGLFQEPGERDAVVIRKVQKRSSSGEAKATSGGKNTW